MDCLDIPEENNNERSDTENGEEEEGEEEEGNYGNANGDSLPQQFIRINLNQRHNDINQFLTPQVNIGYTNIAPKKQSVRKSNNQGKNNNNYSRNNALHKKTTGTLGDDERLASEPSMVTSKFRPLPNKVDNNRNPAKHVNNPPLNMDDITPLSNLIESNVKNSNLREAKQFQRKPSSIRPKNYNSHTNSPRERFMLSTVQTGKTSHAYQAKNELRKLGVDHRFFRQGIKASAQRVNAFENHRLRAVYNREKKNSLRFNIASGNKIQAVKNQIRTENSRKSLRNVSITTSKKSDNFKIPSYEKAVVSDRDTIIESFLQTENEDNGNDVIADALYERNAGRGKHAAKLRTGNY